MPSKETTPIRKQYLKIKAKYPEAIVFFRLGDFYETFDKDAEITSSTLDIVLTSRNVAKGQKVPMAGIPFHAAENYIAKLINKGFHVAICEQIGEQPKKGLFPREVVRLITPGTIIEPGILKSNQNNYLAAILKESNISAIAYIDISTGEFQTTQFEDDKSNKRLDAEISRVNPAEIIIPDDQTLSANFGIQITKIKPWKYNYNRCKERLQRHFSVASLDGFGLRSMEEAISVAGAILQYIDETEPHALQFINTITTYSIDSFMVLDESTRRNLEITQTIRNAEEKGSLVSIIDFTVNPMGKRLLRLWLNKPLLNIKTLNQRQRLVQALTESGIVRKELQQTIKQISDLERLIVRISTNHAIPRDLVALRSTLQIIPKLINGLEQIELIHEEYKNRLHSFTDDLNLLNRSIEEEPPATLQNIGIIKTGYSKELDQIVLSSKSARNWIAKLEVKEQKKTGIKSLKVGFNKIFGYYIEVSKSQIDAVPDDYIRKQTLVNAERYITSEMKEFESIILNAEERIHEIEIRLFHQICNSLAKNINKYKETSAAIAELDVFCSFAEAAISNNYCRPELVEDKTLEIVGGRHPVVEQMQPSMPFIPNDAVFSEDEYIRIITGPNMSGKSTFLRQVALIVLMAQVGSFVPAKSSRIGVVDRIFTRIGSQDEIYAGQSTFMIEMTEVANILNNATDKSLLILDEIGRGTSTFDGLSIAWSIIEYIHNHPNMKSRTLFATHYHELIELSNYLPHVKNFNVAVSEANNTIVFLHKIIPGGSDKSYGIHVAQLAGVPTVVLNRANEILYSLENSPDEANQKMAVNNDQLALFPQTNPIIDELGQIDLNEITPLESLNILYKWKQKFIRD